MTTYIPGAARLYGPEFAAGPQAVYAVLREQHGRVAPVEIAPGIHAHLVIDYRAALDVTTNAGEVWSKNPRPWQATLPDTAAARGLMGMIGWRPNCLFSDGQAQQRYRRVISDCFAMIPPYRMRALVTEYADRLIAEFAGTGRADLVGQYARLILLNLFNRLFGRPDTDSAALTTSLNGLMDATPEEGEAAAAAFGQYMSELLDSKYRRPGDDFTTWLLHHPAALDHNEALHELTLTVGAGNEPMVNLLTNTISRMLTNPRYYASLTDGALSVHDALQEVLREEPSMANYGPYFVTQPVEFHGAWIRPAELVLVSYAAANTTPAALPDGPRSDNGAHLGFGAGAHRCPAADPALLIAATSVERILTLLPGLRLAVPRSELVWRHGPFHRSLAELPVTFTPVRPDQPGETPWTSSSPSPSTPSAATSPANAPACAPPATS
ncbi:cytochrome P450 [Streptomyces sp. NPDC056987]|uniref:cytochrome P450 n=1 Tax=Streptomyces sp. NPDC056987 TaxID=3345988 RepID=UPI00364500C8